MRYYALVVLFAISAAAQLPENSRFHQSASLAASAPNDAFGRSRVSMPVTLLEAASLWDASDDFTTFISGDGASSYTTNKSAVTLTVTSGRVSRVSKRWPAYQKGKSQQLIVTGCFNGIASNGIVKRVGLMNPLTREGLYMEQDSTGVYFVRAGAHTNRVHQSEWFAQPAINWTNTFGLAIDAEWLGIGRVRYALFNPTDGSTLYCHMLLAANLTNTVYTRSLNLPVVYEIEGNGNAAGSMDAICATVQSEGGQDAAGKTIAIDRGMSAISIATQTLAHAAVGVLMDAAKPGTTMFIEGIQTACGTATPSGYRWSLYRSPTLSTTVTWQTASASTVQFSIPTNVFVSGGELVASGYASESASAQDVDIGWSTPIGYTVITNGSALALQSEQLWLCIERLAPSGSAESYVGGLSIREIR